MHLHNWLFCLFDFCLLPRLLAMLKGPSGYAWATVGLGQWRRGHIGDQLTWASPLLCWEEVIST